jgi:hypothetical protein
VGYKQYNKNDKDRIYRLGKVEVRTEESYNTGYDIIFKIRDLYNGPIFSISSLWIITEILIFN